MRELKKGNEGKFSKCDKCGRVVRPKKLVMIRGQFLCYWCKKDLPSSKLMNVGICPAGRRPMTLKQALAKTYIPKPYFLNEDTYVYSKITLPSVLAGRKLKLRLAE